jgi:hypothetical protein
MATSAREAVLGPELYAKVQSSKVLVVGAGEHRKGHSPVYNHCTKHCDDRQMDMF